MVSLSNNFSVKRLIRYLVVIGLTMLFTFGELFEPIDLNLRMIRDKVLLHDASGEVVIASLQEADADSENLALSQFTQKAVEAGAARIVYTGSVTDRLFGYETISEVIKRYPQKVVVALPKGTVPNSFVPEKLFGLVGNPQQIVSENYTMAYWGGLEVGSDYHIIGDGSYRSLPVAVTSKSGELQNSYWVDHSIDVASIPHIDIEKLNSGEQAFASLKGKIVLVNAKSRTQPPLYKILGASKYPIVHTSALAIETLREGNRYYWGGWLSLFVGWVTVLASRRMFNTLHRVWAASAVSAALLILPFAFQWFHFRIHIADGLVIILLGTIYTVTSDLVKREKLRNATHPLSGCKTPNAWRVTEIHSEQFLIAARVEHYAEIVSGFTTGQEREFIRDIIKRLSPAGDTEIIHGEDGQFFWLIDANSIEAINEHLLGTLALFRGGLRAGDDQIFVTLSFGVDVRTATSLDVRMSGAVAAARSAGDNGTDWLIHNVGSAMERKSQSSLAGDLQRAMLANELDVRFQPKLNIATNEIDGFEALARWTHKDRGPISPIEFVAAAERYGGIADLTYYVLRDTLKAYEKMRASGFNGTVSVNLSALLFRQVGAAERILEIIAQSSVPCDRVIMEITETKTIAQADEAMAFFDTLIKAGVGLSIDDYGTGSSTLEQLKMIPAKELKIDRTFVHDILNNPTSHIMLRSTIHLAQALGMRTVVEGIEDDATLEFVAGMGGELAQGYVIAKPMLDDEVIEYLRIKDWVRFARMNEERARSA